MSDSGDLKLRVARTIKWNVIDKVASQVLYAVTGIILANLLTKQDFGLVAAIMVFQAFATLFVDSGFSYALLQRKLPTSADYSTVFWFNLGVAGAIYLLLYIGAPLVAYCFQGDARLIPLSRVMFLSFVVNATAIVQTNRLIKQMNVKMIAVSNSIGLMVSSAVGIGLALTGFGAWAIVWQTISLGAVKSGVLWATSHWMPSLTFSWQSLRSFFRVGMGAMGSSFLNILFQNIYSFFIGNRAGLVPLSYYFQADKWSKMGISSLSQITTASFLPVLSHYQDDPERFAAATAKMNRFTAYVLFPATGFLAVMATPIFHILFGTKWDGSIVLFQLLLFRGIFTVLSALYNNYIIALGKARLMFYAELLRDGVALAAIFITLPYIALTSPDDVTEGIRIFIWGQVIASAVTWAATLIITARLSWRTCWQYLVDLLPYAAETLLLIIPMHILSTVIPNPWVLVIAQSVIGLTLYLAINAALRSKIQRDAIEYLTGRFRRRTP